MAKISPTIPFSNSIGDFSAYKMQGVDKLVIRAKHGPTKEQIETGPQYAKLRLYQSEFSGAGKASATITQASFAIKHLADHSYGGTLTKICKLIQKQDNINPLGERSILFSQYGNILNGFNLNKVNLFDSIVRAPVSHAILRSQSKAVINFPQLHPEINLFNPWQLPLFRFIICLGVIPDMVHNVSGYMPANSLGLQNAVQVQTDWFSAKGIFAETTLEINLRNPGILDNSVSMALSIGIEFGRPISDGINEGVKRAGCGKIVSIG